MHVFSNLPQIELPSSYLDSALKRATKRVSQISSGANELERTQRKEVQRIILVRDSLCKQLEKIHTTWPSIDELPEFYLQLINHSLDQDKLKKSLAAVHFAHQEIRERAKKSVFKVKDATTKQQALDETKKFLSFTAGMVKRVSSSMEYLQKAREVLILFPSLDPDVFTVAIAGFPNVGKSTLLKKITTAKPQIANYAFTTKGLNVGLFEHKFSTIQCVDTPGTLAREKENQIEKLATITRQYIAKIVVYVYDATETYSLADQERLRKNIEEEGHEMLFYVSKTDVLPKEVLANFQKTHPEVLTSPKEVKQAISKAFEKWV